MSVYFSFDFGAYFSPILSHQILHPIGQLILGTGPEAGNLRWLENQMVACDLLLGWVGGFRPFGLLRFEQAVSNQTNNIGMVFSEFFQAAT